MYRQIFPAPPLAPNQQPPPAQAPAQARNHPVSRRKQRALSRRERSLAFLDDKWSGSDWLPADVCAGLASQPGGILRIAVERDLEHKSRNLAEDQPRLPLHLTVSTCEAVRKQLQARRNDDDDDSRNIPSRSASVEDFPDFNDSYAPPDSPVSSVDLFHDAQSIASPQPSLPPATPPVIMSDMETAPKPRNTAIDKATTMENPLANLTWTKDQVQQAQDAHTTAATTIAQLQGEHTAFKASKAASQEYIQRLRNELDEHYEEAGDDGRPLKRRRSAIVDRLKSEHYNHLNETEKHCLNALPENTDLSADIEDASSAETETAAALASAKAHLSSIEEMWEAKSVIDEAVEAKNKYDTLQQKMGELKDEMATACDHLYYKRDAADKWVKLAENEGWEALLVETDE
ncbi:hypothetical protein ACHAPU_011281 [Fusarium lateritium]